MDSLMEEGVDGRMDSMMEGGWMDGRMESLMDGWVERWMDELID